LKVNGVPVSWGSVVFTPLDASAPIACARVMRGSFKLKADQGPVVGKVRLTLSYSAADVSGLETMDGTVTTHEKSPGSGAWEIDLKENHPNLALEVSR
jgi:hypothetical protein